MSTTDNANRSTTIAYHVRLNRNYSPSDFRRLCWRANAVNVVELDLCWFVVRGPLVSHEKINSSYVVIGRRDFATYVGESAGSGAKLVPSMFARNAARKRALHRELHGRKLDSGLSSLTEKRIVQLLAIVWGDTATVPDVDDCPVQWDYETDYFAVAEKFSDVGRVHNYLRHNLLAVQASGTEDGQRHWLMLQSVFEAFLQGYRLVQDGPTTGPQTAEPRRADNPTY